MRERLLPSQEVLAQRLFRQSQDLADAQRHLQRYHDLVVSLQRRIRQFGEQQRDDAALRELDRFVTQGLARALATESVDYLEVMDGMLKVMSAQVTVRPSGHEFTVEGHATLLQAGLHAGLMLNYGCGNGTCGMCKVRVISGEVARTQPFDYPLSEAERRQGYTLACAHTAASSELTLELLEAGGPQDIPQQQIVSHVRAISRAGARHAAAASADTAYPPPALPGRAVGDAGPGRRRPRRARHPPGGQLPLRRPQPAFLHRPR